MITAPTVRLLAHTTLDTECDDLMNFEEDSTDGDSIAVFAGRACYQSFAKTYAPTRFDADYLGRTVHTAKHFSVIEHGGAAFYITGVSRSLTHELVRHRQLGYSQLSQRYVPSEDLDWVCPPEDLDRPAERQANKEAWEQAMGHYERKVGRLMQALGDEGVTGTEARKRARQTARAVLPNMCETRIVVSGNYRAWLEAMGKRNAPGAEPEIRRLFGDHLLPRLCQLAPVIFAGA